MGEDASGPQSVLEAEPVNLTLSVCPPRRWGCPVIMKLDPERVAGTCRWCGLVATTERI